MSSIPYTQRAVAGVLLTLAAQAVAAQDTPPPAAPTAAQAAAQAAIARANAAAQAATEAAAAAQAAAAEAAAAQAAADGTPLPPAVATVSAPPADGAISGIEARAVTRSSQYLEVVEEVTPFTMTEEDRALTLKVIDIIADDPKMKGHIQVSARNGVVILSGTVKSVPMIYRAVELSRRVGVTQVNVDRLDKKHFF